MGFFYLLRADVARCVLRPLTLRSVLYYRLCLYSKGDMP